MLLFIHTYFDVTRNSKPENSLLSLNDGDWKDSDLRKYGNTLS